jgi:predicted TIM-barrel fold metal-dependent hydrolase
VEIVDAQVHLPRLVVDGKPGRARTTDDDVPVKKGLGLPLWEPADPDIVIVASLTAMDAAGVDALVIDEWVGHDEAGWSQPGKPVGEGAYRWNFDFSRYAASRYPERFSFLARVHPFDPELDDVVAELTETPGMRCLRVDPMPWLPDIEAFKEGKHSPVFEAALRHDLPVCVWSNGPYLPNIEQYLRLFPDVRIMIDHLGSSNPPVDATGAARYGTLDTLMQLGRGYENLSVKWSTVETKSAEAYPYRDMFPYLLRALEAFGRERVIWASDWSEHKLQQSWARSYLWVLESSELSADDKKWILGRSARSWLRWPAVGDAVGAGMYFDCANVHGAMRISGMTEDEFVDRMRAHLDTWHPHYQVTREQIVAWAKG